jgi:pimeloyl-ACP methyl ester carboxylesterase
MVAWHVARTTFPRPEQGELRRLPRSAARALAGGIRGARFVSVPGSGHAPHYDAPAVVHAAVLAFLAVT